MIFDYWSEICDLRSLICDLFIRVFEDKSFLHRAWDQRFLWSCLWYIWLFQVKNFVCHNRGHLEVPILCPPPLGEQLVKCWAFTPEERPSFLILLKTIKELFVYKEKLKNKLCHTYVPSLLQSYAGNSRDTWKDTFGITISSTTRSQATTIPCHHPR